MAGILGFPMGSQAQYGKLAAASGLLAALLAILGPATPSACGQKKAPAIKAGASAQATPQNTSGKTEPESATKKSETPDGEKPYQPRRSPAEIARDLSKAGQSKKLIRLAKDYAIWLDPQRRLLVMDGEVTLREGQLEMFACPSGTKEHESVVAVDTPARFVHAGLLAIGAKPGKPVQFRPEYRPATGTIVDILVLWKDKTGKERMARAQEWVKDARTGKQLKYDWVFAGSGFWEDEENGDKHYYGDGGDFVCVSNFPTATLDLPVESSQQNNNLLYSARTKAIPARGTKIRLVMIPRLAPPKKPTGKQPAKGPAGSKSKTSQSNPKD